jgi:hypothetical protein
MCMEPLTSGWSRSSSHSHFILVEIGEMENAWHESKGRG